jgi:hypothetical protein
MKRFVLILAAGLLAADVHAACNLNLQKTDLNRGKRWELSWSLVSGATGYTLESIRVDAETDTTTIRSVDVEPRGGSLTVKKEVAVLTSVPLTVKYRVTAVGASEPCSATIDVSYPADTAFQRMTRKSVIPFVGSTLGANGSNFKTSLRLRGTGGVQKGELIFHPVNTPGHDSDPFITYSLQGTSSVIEYDDIGAAFGIGGIASIDIVPDFSQGNGWTVPAAEVRIFNVAPEGTYGTLEAQTQAYDYLGESIDPIKTLSVTVPQPQLRLNLAVRTFEEAALNIEVRREGVVIVSKDMQLAADFLLFNSAPVLTGIDLHPGDIITLSLPDGGGVPLYTLTDNETNDPALFMPPVRIDLNVGEYDVGF